MTPQTTTCELTQQASAGKKTRGLWRLLLPLVLYAAALNPYFSPGTYDDVLYYFGAVSVAEEGSFQFRDKYVTDWPPGLSVLLAIPFSLGLQSVMVAKTCILICAAIGLIVAWYLFQKERRPFPMLTLALFALLPVSFMMGTRIMSEWPYFLASMLFLHALDKVRVSDRRVRAAVFTGLLLGMTALTKFTGMFLGAAVLAQMAGRWRQSETKFSFRTIRSELIVAVIGAAIFLAWKAKIQWQINVGTAAGYEYYRAGWVPMHFGWADLFAVPRKITDLFFHTEALKSFLGWHPSIQWACAVPGFIVLIGMFSRLFSVERSPSDWYPLALLVAFSSFEGNQQTRYLFPIAPFLISYGFLGFKVVSRLLWAQRTRLRACCVWIPGPKRLLVRSSEQVWSYAQNWRGARLCQVFAIAWIVLLCGSAFQVLFYGNLSGSHRGLCYLASPTPEKFYRGFWLDLYRVCRYVKEDPTPGLVAVLGDEDKYITAFIGRPWVPFDSAHDFSFLLVVDRTDLPAEQVKALNLRCLKRCESLVLYKTVIPDRVNSANPPVGRKVYGKL